MISSVRRAALFRALVSIAAVLVIAAGCTSAASPSPLQTASPSATPGLPTATAAPTETAVPSGACQFTEQPVVPPSNTLVGLAIASDGTADRLTFTFGEQAANPTETSGRLRPAMPPFAHAGSGLPVEVLGARFVELHLDGMLIADEAGNGIYRGPASLKPALAALKDVEQTDGFEGVYNFVIGYDGNGCVGLQVNVTARTLLVTIGH
jgi:hypothetical protein